MAKTHIKDCSNCKHSEVAMDLLPCRICDDHWYDKWEVKETETESVVEPVMSVDELREAMERFNASAKKAEESLARFTQTVVNDKFAKELKGIYDSLINNGFTEKQAFALLNTLVKSSYGYGR